MALLASTEMLPESWMSSPTQISSHALPEDIWSKFDIEHDRALALANPTAMETNTALSYGGTNVGPFSSPPHHSGGYIGGVCVTTLPTPPRSPPTEHDLDDLVASIPEILDSSSASPPSDISDIISDLETSTMDQSMEATSNWITNWPLSNVFASLPTQQSLKSDIMWGGGHCCAPALEPAAKKRSISECSVDRALANVLKPDNDLSDSDDDDNLPDTPSGTDSDGDDHMSDTSIVTVTSRSSSSTNSSPTHYNSHHHHHSPHSHHQSPHSHHQFRITSSPTTTTHSERIIVNSEHNYCGRVPEINPQHVGGNITPSDTEDEVDVVGDHHIPTLTSTPMVTSTTSPHLTTPSKGSVDVKRKLQLAINESRLKRQNKANETSSPIVTSTIDSCRFVSVKIKTQGKPASYTKRMRDYHSEQVLKSTKNNRRRNRGESDEGRRSVHNSLERQRRVDLRNAFETLRLLVPDTKVLDKAPKVQILKKAAFHCKALQIQEHRLLREKEKLKKQIEYLKQQRRICS